VVTSPLPGDGKSTVSMALASAAALAGQRVLLVECDLRRPCFAGRLGIAATPGLTDYLLGQARPQDVLQTVDVVEPMSTAEAAGSSTGNGELRVPPPAPPEDRRRSLVCVTAGAPARNGAELLVSVRFREFLSKVSKAYDFVVIDSSPMLSVVDSLELIPQVSGTLFCVRVDERTRDEVRAARTALARLPERPMGAVVTGMSRKGPDAYEYYDEY
jgi:non-specific protein-tyrosine kinase